MGGIALLAILIFLIIAGSRKKSADTQTNQTSAGDYYDSKSGQTVSDPANRAPENYGGTTAQPVFLGITSLLNIGVTNYQLNATKQAFEQFAAALKKPGKEFSVTVASITSIPEDKNNPDSRPTASFELTIDRTASYQARLEYFDVTAVRLVVPDSSGKSVFDSGTVDLTAGD